jgi:hypothetical protein
LGATAAAAVLGGEYGIFLSMFGRAISRSQACEPNVIYRVRFPASLTQLRVAMN